MFNFSPAWPALLVRTMLAVGTLLLSACTPMRVPESVYSAPAPMPVPAPVPVPSPAPSVTLSVRAPRPADAPTSPAVPVLSPRLEAQFPDPPARYSTPGLQQGRMAWSSAEEIAAWLRDLAAPPIAPPASAAQGRRGSKVKLTLLNLVPPPPGLDDLAPSPSSGAGLFALHLSAARRTPAPSPDSELQKPPAKPTVLLLGGAQASAATEALLLVARELTLGKLRPLLARINVVLVPNTALAEAVDPIVPDDHVQLNTASAQMLASLAHTQQATVVISVDEVPALTQLGTQTLLRAADVMVAPASLQNLPEFLTRAGDQWFQQPMLAALKAEALRADGDSGGPAMAGEEKNAAHIANAAALKNRIGLQITTAGSDLGRAHVQRRVHAQVTAISSALVSTAKRTAELAELLPYLDREVAAQACRQPLAAVQPVQPAEQNIRWLDLSTGGEISVPPAAGNTMQEPAAPESLRIKPCGYWLATASGQAVERLRLHGVRVMRVSEPTSLLGDTYNRDKSAASDKHASTRAGAPAQADRGQVTASPYKLVRGLIDAPLGSYYVPVDQALGNLVVTALEPDGPSSLAASGLINVAAGLARIMTPPTVKLGPFDPSTHSDKERP